MSYRDVIFWAMVGGLVIGALWSFAPDRPEVVALAETLGGEVAISGL